MFFLRYVALKNKLYIASAVDPCFKALPFLSDEARDNTFSRLMTEAAGLEQVETSDVSYRSIEKRLFLYTTVFKYSI